IAEARVDGPGIVRRPRRLELEAVDARLAGVRDERRDAVRRRTAVSHLHVRVVGREHRAFRRKVLPPRSSLKPISNVSAVSGLNSWSAACCAGWSTMLK